MEKWICPNCETLNPAESQFCEICGMLRPGVIVPEAAANSEEKRSARGKPENNGGQTTGMKEAITLGSSASESLQKPDPETEVRTSVKQKKRKKWLKILLSVFGGLFLAAVVAFFTVHDWQPATCGAPETCSICGRTRGEPTGKHRWEPATCLRPRTCKVCGQTDGEPGSHCYSERTCTDERVCSFCGDTTGGPLGHDWIQTSNGEQYCARCYVQTGEIPGGKDAQYGIEGGFEEGWADLNGQYASVFAPVATVEKCYHLRLYLYEFEFGKEPAENWKLYSRGRDNHWTEVATFKFQMPKENKPAVFEFKFDRDIDFTGLAIVPEKLVDDEFTYSLLYSAWVRK